MRKQQKIKNIYDMEIEKPQSPNKYRIYRAFPFGDGKILYNFSRLFKGEQHLTNFPLYFQSNLEAKKSALGMLKATGEKITVKNIEVISL